MVYLAGAGLVGLGNVILLPLYTRCLSTAHFGVYALLDVTVLIVVTVAQMGLLISYLKWFADLDESLHPELLGSAVGVTLVSSTLGGLVLFAILQWIPGLDAAAGRLTPWLLLAIVPLEGVQGLLLSDLRARRRSVPFCAAAAARLLVMAAASVWFVQIQKQDIAGVLLGRLVGDAAGVLMLGALSLPHAAARFNLEMIRGMLRYGFPLVWSALVTVGMDASGRYVLARQMGLDQVAVYTVALKISNVMQVAFVQPFGTAWGSIMFQIAHDRNAPASIAKILNYAFVTGMMLAAGISILSPVVLPLFGSGAYARAGSLVPWLLLVPAFRVLEYRSSLGLYLGRKTGWLAATASAGAALNISLLLLMVPRFGAFGAAQAWFLSLVAMICANSWLSNRHFKLPANGSVILLGLALWTGGAVAAGFLPVGFSLTSVSLALGACVVLAAPVLLYCAKRLVSERGIAA